MSPSRHPPNRIGWVRIADLDSTMANGTDHFVALDAAGQDIGVVKRIEQGPEGGQWLWSMTRVHPGKPLNVLRSGTEKTRREAALALIASWRAFRKWYGIGD